jgi:hypothetical protein
MVLTLIRNAREQRRLIALENRIDELDRRIHRLALGRGRLNDLRLGRLISKKVAAMAEWNRLRWKDVA